MINLFKSDTSRLREELNNRNVTVRITDACLRDLIADAGKADKEALATRADFITEWTMVDAEEAERKYGEALARIARKHALPRAWKVNEPAVKLAEHPTPTYLYWASAS